jgi:hypothetical protein
MFVKTRGASGPGGANREELAQISASGMLLSVAAALDPQPALDDSWMKDCLHLDAS